MFTFKTCSKGIILILTVLLFTSNAELTAQYRVNKLYYDYHAYSYERGDPHQPAVCGVVSFIIPGVGQMISREFVRGFGFLGGYAGCWVLCGVGYGVALVDVFEKGGTGTGGLILCIVGFVGALSVDICSTVDAVRVAKVNNMAWRDKYRSGTGLKITPDIKILPGQKVVPALTLAYRF